jgi:hypothetical protein
MSAGNSHSCPLTALSHSSNCSYWCLCFLTFWIVRLNRFPVLNLRDYRSSILTSYSGKDAHSDCCARSAIQNYPVQVSQISPTHPFFIIESLFRAWTIHSFGNLVLEIVFDYLTASWHSEFASIFSRTFRTEYRMRSRENWGRHRSLSINDTEKERILIMVRVCQQVSEFEPPQSVDDRRCDLNADVSRLCEKYKALFSYRWKERGWHNQRMKLLWNLNE